MSHVVVGCGKNGGGTRCTDQTPSTFSPSPRFSDSRTDSIARSSIRYNESASSANTSSLNARTVTDWSQDPRFGQADALRESGRDHHRSAQDHADNAGESLHDCRPYEAGREMGQSFSELRQAHRDYTDANRAENQVGQDASAQWHSGGNSSSESSSGGSGCIVC